ncbi:MAG: uncharacterized protein QOJ35_1115 [Solirubrobacteraceae bacterium]|jgi:lysophospholipase L1-like esterase|nr:uncharacterized protein [Solirubrobacteraceae bacterium]
MPRAWRAVALAGLAALLAPGAAHGEPLAAVANPCAKPRVTNFLAADATHPGVINLDFFGAQGSRVAYFECIQGRARSLGTRRAKPGKPTIMRGATTWSCDRLVRRFVATTLLPDGSLAAGTYSVRTRSCAQRFQLDAPRRIAPGARLGVRVVDRWGIGGIRTQLCITPPHGRDDCAEIAFPRAVSVDTRHVRAERRGRWRVELRAGGVRMRTTVAVGVRGLALPPPLPTVLATGDSMMQGIDGFLADALDGTLLVRSDVRPGTAIGRGPEWLQWSRAQVDDYSPDTTVMSIGANEGWPMPLPEGGTVDCCGEPWVAAYADRVRTIMQTYLRNGRGRVIWLTLPAPRDGRLVMIIAAVNEAILRAADGMDGVSVLRMDRLFTPDGYRDVMRYAGRDVRVREPDGVHLNVSGTSIAATAIAQELISRTG